MSQSKTSLPHSQRDPGSCHQALVFHSGEAGLPQGEGRGAQRRHVPCPEAQAGMWHPSSRLGAGGRQSGEGKPSAWGPDFLPQAGMAGWTSLGHSSLGHAWSGGRGTRGRYGGISLQMTGPFPTPSWHQPGLQEPRIFLSTYQEWDTFLQRVSFPDPPEPRAKPGSEACRLDHGHPTGRTVPPDWAFWLSRGVKATEHGPPLAVGGEWGLLHGQGGGWVVPSARPPLALGRPALPQGGHCRLHGSQLLGTGDWDRAGNQSSQCLSPSRPPGQSIHLSPGTPDVVVLAFSNIP